jgi:hypothetical protein
MMNKHRQRLTQNQAVTYQIRVRGQIGERWASWFDEMTLTYTSEGDTLLTGVILDQAALYGILNKLRNLNLDLISVCPIDATSSS